MAIDISEFPVMKTCCATCPFRTEEDGRMRDTEVASRVMARLLNACQICHHPRIKGQGEVALCRGARDHQLTLFYRMGLIDAPTDEAWNKLRYKA